MALLETALPGLPVRRGKVRDVYDLGDRLLMVATDRISAYDWILPNGIPDKGRILTGISAFWCDWFHQGHVISTDLDEAGLDLTPEVRDALTGRSMVVVKAEVIPFECVVRGYLAGSAWREYRTTETVCGVRLPAGLVEGSRIRPIFTPATKAETGHDENIPFARLVEVLGPSLAENLKRQSLMLYSDAHLVALDKGLILADTKFEWGLSLGWRDSVNSVSDLLLIDEVLTPDSSRYWPLDGYTPGGPQPSFDKQFVRDWLDASGWDKASPPPSLPEDVVDRTRAKYIQAYEMLIGAPFPWT